MRAPSDGDLWRRSVAGDGDAFGALYERHSSAIYNYCFRGTGDWASAEDLCAAVFLEAWRNRARVRFTGEDAILPWLYGVATNVMRNHARAGRRFVRALAVLTGGSRAPRADETVERLVDEERMRGVLGAVSRLPRHERDVVALCVFGDLSYEEAALVLDVPMGTVRSRLSRARGRLRELAPASGHEGVISDDDESAIRSAASTRARG